MVKNILKNLVMVDSFRQNENHDPKPSAKIALIDRGHIFVIIIQGTLEHLQHCCQNMTNKIALPQRP